MTAATNEVPDTTVKDDETLGQMAGPISVDERLGLRPHVAGETSSSLYPVDAWEPERTFVTHLREDVVPAVERHGGFAPDLIHHEQEAGTAVARALWLCAR